MEGRGGAGNDGVELEVRRKDTFSWHPCHVSLRSTGLGLLVQYKDGNSQEIIEGQEDVIARIRVRSSHLEGDDCMSIQHGDHVLASRNSHVEWIFYDARIEEAVRVRHSKRSYCRCSFTIKWLDNAFKGEALTLPASNIMKLSKDSIKLHPTISAFFSIVDTPSSTDALPFSTTSDDDCEMDINVMLERQIKEITYSNNVPAKVSQKIVIGREVDGTGGKATAALFKDLCTTVTNLKGSTESNNVHSVVKKIKKSPASVPTIQEEVTGIRLSPLNPLSAWSALASLRSKFPQSVEHSSPSNEITFSMSATLEGKTPKFEGVVKTLFPCPDDSQISGLPDEPIRENGKRLVKGNKDSGNKVNPHPERRATRSQTQTNNRMHVPVLMPDGNDTESRSSSKIRVTRSTINNAENLDLEESKRVTEENMSTKLTMLECGAHHLRAESNCITSSKISVASTFDSKKNTSDEIAKSLSGKDGPAVNFDSSQGTLVEGAKDLKPYRRFTRSAAQDHGEKNNFQPKPETRKRQYCESSELKLENNVISNSICTEVKKSTSPIRSAKISASDAKEGESTPTITEPAMDPCPGRKKPTNSRMQATRSSPRFNFLQQTCSRT